MIGVEIVYRQLLPHIYRVFVTKIEAEPHSDVFFPDLDASPDWRMSDAGGVLEEDGIRYRFTVYERK